MHLVIEKENLIHKHYFEFLDKEIRSYIIKDRLPNEITAEFLMQKDTNITFYFIKKYAQYIIGIDDNILILFARALETINISTEMNDLLLQVAKNTLPSVKIENFIRFISYLTLNDKDFEFISAIFSYTEIYKYSKKVLSTFLKKNYRVNEIGYSLVILNHPKLCYKNLLPLFKQINQLLDPNNKTVLESSFINICKGMQAIIKYLPETFKDKKELLLGVLTFINRSLFLTELYEFIDTDDLYIVLHTIKVLASNIEIDKRTKNVMKSSFSKSINQIYFFKESKTIKSEEVLFYIAVMNLANIYIGISELKTDKMADIFEVVEDLDILNVEISDHLFLITLSELFLYEKYRLLQKLEVFTGFRPNTTKFINDIRNLNNIDRILQKIDINQLDVDILMPYCTDRKFQKGFATKIFELKEKYYDYIFIFLDSLLSKKNLYTQLLVLKNGLLYKLASHQEYFTFLFRLFCQDCNDEDMVFWEIKCEVLNHLFNSTSLNFNLYKFPFSHTINHYVLLLILLNLYDDIRPSTVLKFLRYFNVGLNRDLEDGNSTPEDKTKDFKKEDNICDLLKQNLPVSKDKDVAIIREFKELKIRKIPLKEPTPPKEFIPVIFNHIPNYNIEIHLLALLCTKIKHQIVKELFNERNFRTVLIRLLAIAFAKDKNIPCDLEKQLIEYLFFATDIEKEVLKDLYIYIQEDKKSNLQYLTINEEIQTIMNEFRTDNAKIYD